MAPSAFTREEVLALVLEELRDALERSESPAGTHATESTKLMGSNAPLDSVGLVSMIIGVERRVRERSGKRIALADGRALSHRPSPFRTAGALADYITASLMGDGRDT